MKLFVNKNIVKITLAALIAVVFTSCTTYQERVIVTQPSHVSHGNTVQRSRTVTHRPTRTRIYRDGGPYVVYGGRRYWPHRSGGGYWPYAMGAVVAADAIDTVDTIDTIDAIDTVDAIDTMDMVDTMDAVDTMDMVDTMDYYD